jgi:serine/threonine-protein kinase
MNDASVITHVPGRKSADRAPVDRGVAIGELLGKCLLTDLIGRGGSCVVFRALHQGLNVPVAVKVLPLDAGEAHRRAYNQLKFEARLLAQLPHPHIVRVFDFEDNPVLPFLVLECVEGPTLADLIQQSGHLSLDRAAEIIGQISEALGALWKLGAVHRDVKPGNVLLARDGLAKLADFGQAVLVEEQEIADFNQDKVAPETVSGTAAYLAPEQFLAPDSVDHRSDIYALGATFYHAITGELPFEGRSRLEVLLKRTRETPTPPDEIIHGLPPRVTDVILTMMARDPCDRYQHLDEVRDALTQLTGAAVSVAVAANEDVAAVSDFHEPKAEPVDNAPDAKGGTGRDSLEEPTAQRRSFWRSLLPRSTTSAEPVAQTPNDEWMQFVKRTLSASARKRDE